MAEVLTSQAMIKELWQGTTGEGCSVLLAAMDSKVEESDRGKRRVVLATYGKMLPKSRYDKERTRVTASWERGRNMSTPSARNDKTFLRYPEGIQHGLNCSPEGHCKQLDRSKAG